LQTILSWLGVVIAIVVGVIAWFTYRSQRNLKRFEYVVVYRQRILFVPSSLAGKLEVVLNGETVKDPVIVSVRMVNTGDRAILSSDFHEPLALQLHGSQRILSATVTSSRPSDFKPQLSIDESRVVISPTLINPGDLIELQVIASGPVRDVALQGRVADVVPVKRPGLPYPPGSGPEGEMLAIDKVMWGLLPGLLLAVTAIAVIAIATTQPVAIVPVVSVIAGLLAILVIYLQRVRYLIRRRRIWRP
jgi:hypothetical protein